MEYIFKRNKINDSLGRKWIQDRFRNKKINCSFVAPSRLEILESLYVLTYLSSARFKKPLGFHVRVRFTDKMDMRRFSARLGVFYQRKSGYTPLRVSAKENDPMDDGVHYHMAIVLEGKYDRKTSLQYFLAELKKKKYLVDYKVISPDSKPSGEDLNDEKGRDHFFFWLSYLAKEQTKHSGEQSISRSKSVQSDLAGWKANGKPVLLDVGLAGISQGARIGVLECLWLDHIGLHRVPPILPSNRRQGAPSGNFNGSH